jgi:hypothetical protein
MASGQYFKLEDKNLRGLIFILSVWEAAETVPKLKRIWGINPPKIKSNNNVNNFYFRARTK